MRLELSPCTRLISFHNIYYSYSRIRLPIEMKSYSGLIAIFLHIFLQTSTKSKAASIPTRNSGPLWMTDELQPVQDSANSNARVDTPLEDMAKKLLRLLDEMYSLIDVMPADDPNANNDNGYQPGVPCVANVRENLTWTQRNELSKQLYLEYYKQRIIAFTGIIPSSSSSKPVENNLRNQQLEPLNDIIKKAEERQELAAFSYSPRMMSLYPTCNNSNVEDPSATTIHLAFDLSISKPPSDTFMNVTSAVLKIYKKPLRKNSTDPAFSPNRNVTFMAVYFKNPHNKKDPSKKGTKLGEQTLRAEEERWTEWDIRKAVSAWYNNTSRNNGITIKVADDQIHLPAREYFNIPINCSYITDWPRLIPEVIRNGSYAGMSTSLPFLDVTVEEVPKKEIKFAEKEQEFLSGVDALKQKVNAGYDSTNSSTEHRIRHHKKNKDTSKETEVNL